jgi:type I restriction enzyme S subunit
MKPETFFDNFDVLAEAPNGVQKLRELILQLAVRGKLVAQDEKDKSTGVLIGKIKDERERLIKENKIKKGIVLPPINLNEIPFLIPKSWVFVRLNDIGDWGSGSTPDRKNNDFYGGKILWFKSGELNDGYIKESEEKITELALEKCSLRKNKPGDVLFAMYGATVGKLAILEVDATTNQAVCACTCHTGFYNRYLFYLLMAYKNRFINESSGAAQPNFSKDKIIQTIVPLPPLAEQHRIVAKVNQLMSLCDELEAHQQKKRETRAHLNSAALDRLLAARAPGEFAEGWRRIYDNFDLLYDAPENVGALRQVILQLAVMGKLVEQDERDEPAGVLVERLNKERNIKKTNDLIPIHENEIPYEIPKGWKWVRLGNIFSLKTGATPSTKNPNYWSGNISWLKSGDVNQGEIFDCEGRITEKGLENSNCKILPIDSVLIALNGQGKTRGTVAMLKIEAACNQSLVAMISENKNDFIPEYLLFYLKANYMNMRNITGHKQRRGLNMKIVGNLLVALPPSEEQRRIVARVDQLMSLCDELEAGLARSQADSERLMEAVVGRMLAGGDSVEEQNNTWR